MIRMARLLPRFALVLALVVSASGARAQYRDLEELNWYDWCSVAPVVISARTVDADGRFTVVAVDRVLRGPLAAGDSIRIDIRNANRERGSQADALRLDPAKTYLFLLQETTRKRPEDPATFVLVRDVSGVRELPAEGAEATLSALEVLVAIQGLADYGMTWKRFQELLEDVNPILVETVLQQYVKFDRADAETLPAVEPLLDHPRAAVRRLASAAAGAGLADARRRGLADVDTRSVEQALMARARGDGTPDVRVAATRALAGVPGDEITAVLEEIARDDPEQEVRYEAERALWGRRPGAIDRRARGS